MNRFMKAGGAVVLALIVLLGINHFRVNTAAQEASRSADVLAYYRFGAQPNVIVFDLRDIDRNASSALIMGNLLRFAAEMKDRQFDAVHLAWRGRTKFILPGAHFRTIGREFAFQNPVYTIRTLPEHLLRPDGRRAFGTWSGGMLGVLGAQMDDVNRFAAEWFINDYAASRR